MNQSPAPRPTPVPAYPAFDEARRAIVSVARTKGDAARRKETKLKQLSRRKGTR
jgi:hypothetical protein